MNIINKIKCPYCHMSLFSTLVLSGDSIKNSVSLISGVLQCFIESQLNVFSGDLDFMCYMV